MACHVLKQVDYVVLVYERHLTVYLSELRLAVSTQVLVAEALGYLEVTVETADHKQLLQGLGALRQCVELARIHSRRHHEVACSLGSTAYKNRCLHLYKLPFVEEVAYEYRHAVAQLKVFPHRRTAQVEVSVLHADVITAIGIVLYGERWSKAL